MKCAEARKSIGLSLDGELEKSKIPALEKHLAGCLSCSREKNFMVVAQAAFQKVSRENADQLSAAGLTDRIFRRIAETKTKSAWDVPRWFALRLALPLGAVLLLLSILFFRQHNAASALENYLTGDLHALTSSFYNDLASAR